MARKTKRDEDISRRPAIKKRLLEVFEDVEKGFNDQSERSDSIADNWDAYNCQLGPKQFYNGTAQFYVPLIHDAIEARVTRFTNQLFPQSGRYVDVTGFEDSEPWAIAALLEHYVDRTRLRTEVVPALLRAGDCEGQWTIYIDWNKTSRNVVRRAQKPLRIAGMDMPTEHFEPTETVEEERVEAQQPAVEVISDADFLVLPATTDSLEKALEEGGSVTVIRRWSKSKIRKLMEDGDIDRDAGETMLKEMSNGQRNATQNKDPSKVQADAAGIKTKAGNKFCLVYETWVRLKVDGSMRLCRSYYGGEQQVLGCKLCPYWCDLPPVLSAAVQKVKGRFKGKPPVDYVLDLQILANDYLNEGADTAHFSAMPIVMSDPIKNPRLETMVLGLGAIWQTSPTDTQFAQFPDLWRSAIDRVMQVKDQIFQTLGVNPSMIPQSTSTKKRNQAELATEQQVDLLTTADTCTAWETSIGNPMLQRFADYDHQFRDEEMSIEVYGELGEGLRIESIDPVQAQDRFVFRWLGVESARNAARIQQQIAGTNVLMKLPPNAYPGYKLNLAPAIVNMVDNLFGPRIARLVFVDQRKQVTVDPETENQMLENGFAVNVHPGDDDAKHIEAHMQAMKMAGSDPHGTFRAHIQAHQGQMQQKAQMAQMQQQGQGGAPGGGQGPQPMPAPGAAAGAQPGVGRGVKGPPGMIHQDRMPAAGAVSMPRKM